MAAPELIEQQNLRIAVEGCGHGVLHEIYASVAKACELKGWPEPRVIVRFWIISLMLVLIGLATLKVR